MPCPYFTARCILLFDRCGLEDEHQARVRVGCGVGEDCVFGTVGKHFSEKSNCVLGFNIGVGQLPDGFFYAVRLGVVENFGEFFKFVAAGKFHNGVDKLGVLLGCGCDALYLLDRFGELIERRLVFCGGELLREGIRDGHERLNVVNELCRVGTLEGV